jgi:outer membrane protein assembly factor BamB
MKWRLALLVLAISLCAPALIQTEAIHTPRLGILWRYATGGQIRSRPEVAADGTIYALSEDGFLYAWDPGGSLLWKRDLGWLPSDCLALGGDGTIYAGLKNKDFLAINASGHPLWRFHLDGLPAGDPAVAADGTVYVSTTAGTLAALSHLGRPQWTVTLPGAITHAPVVDGAGTIYLVAADRRLYALTQWGEFKWSLPLAAVPTALAVAAAGTVLVGTAGGSVIAVNPSGDIAWRYSADERIAGVSAGTGQIIVASSSGQLIGLSDRGRLLWKIVIGKRIESAPLLGQSFPCAFATDGTLHLLDPERPGTDSFAVGTFGSIVLSREGIFYVGGRDWILYSIGVPGPVGTAEYGSTRSGNTPYGGALGRDTDSSDAREPSAAGDAGSRASAAWPQEGHDEAHSGRTDAGPPGGNETLLNAIPDYLYLQSLEAVNNRDILLSLLARIHERIDDNSIGKSTWYVVRLLEQLSAEGLLNPVYRNLRVINSFPDVRAEAARLLGRVGSIRSRHALIQVIANEYDPFALSAEIGALGFLASDSDGASTRAIAAALSRAGMSPPDDRIAAAALDALEMIGAYEGGAGEPAAAAFLAISRGDFPQQIRSRASSLLRKDPN